ncbi:MAG: hypothetical protein SFU53_09720 [Terrimicrobiaceae bacterium]|nr:hypothetical protein [Terrimicrobiaceae bacterium]
MKAFFLVLTIAAPAVLAQTPDRDGEPNPSRDASGPAIVAPPASGPQPGDITRPRSVGVGNEGLGNATGTTSGTGILDDRTGSAVTGEIPNAPVDPSERVGRGGGRPDATGTDPDAATGTGTISNSTAPRGDTATSPTATGTPAAHPGTTEPTGEGGSR